MHVTDIMWSYDFLAPKLLTEPIAFQIVILPLSASRLLSRGEGGAHEVTHPAPNLSSGRGGAHEVTHPAPTRAAVW